MSSRILFIYVHLVRRRRTCTSYDDVDDSYLLLLAAAVLRRNIECIRKTPLTVFFSDFTVFIITKKGKKKEKKRDKDR